MNAHTDDPERIPRDSAAAADRRVEGMAILARRREWRRLPLSGALLSSASPLAIILGTEL